MAAQDGEGDDMRLTKLEGNDLQVFLEKNPIWTVLDDKRGGGHSMWFASQQAAEDWAAAQSKSWRSMLLVVQIVAVFR